MTQLLGIDLGTTNSVVATIDERGAPVVLRNPLAEETTPSVVWFSGPGLVVVGKAAKNAAPAFVDRTVSLIKRQMGTNRLRLIDDVEYTPEAISALILRALVDGAAPGRPRDEPVCAVITVPAYFGIREREATQAAAALAGIEVLELISEPVAAAIHYGFSEDAGIANALFYDLGGGTFDATVLRLGGRVEVVATDGDAELGGADWDARLVAHLMAAFVAEAAPVEDPADDDEFMAELLLVAEQAKQALARTQTHRVPVRWRGHSVTVTIDRPQFEAMTADLLARTLDITRRLVTTAAAKGVDVIDRCLLVGGSSHMPAVATALQREFGWEPRLYDPDLAVAKGAALRAHQLLPLAVVAGPAGRPASGSATRPTPQAVPSPRQAGVGERAGVAVDEHARTLAASVAPRSLGVLIEDSHDKAGLRSFVQHVIHGNDALPATGRLTVSTIVDNQRSVHLQVYEQASSIESDDVAANRLVLDGELTGLSTPKRAGSPLTLTLTLTGDGRLGVVVDDPASGDRLNLEAYIDGVVDRVEQQAAQRSVAALTVRH